MAYHPGPNPANSAMPYLNQIPGQTLPYMQPYAQAGFGAYPALQGSVVTGNESRPFMQREYGGLINDPSQKLNSIGAGYQQSPGLNFAIQRALDASGHAAAAGGMAGSPQHQEQNIGLATNYANQDYNNWMQQALGLYGAGLSGGQGLVNNGQQAAQNLYGQGQQAGMSMADMVAQNLAQQGNLAFNGQSQQNMNDLMKYNMQQQQKNQNWNNAFKGLGFLGSMGSLSAFNPLSWFGNGMSSDMFGGS